MLALYLLKMGGEPKTPEFRSLITTISFPIRAMTSV